MVFATLSFPGVKLPRISLSCPPLVSLGRGDPPPIRFLHLASLHVRQFQNSLPHKIPEQVVAIALAMPSCLPLSLLIRQENACNAVSLDSGNVLLPIACSSPQGSGTESTLHPHPPGAPHFSTPQPRGPTPSCAKTRPF